MAKSVSMALSRLNPQGRGHRRPTHTFQLRQTPYCIQPFLIAPVLPGETMRNCLLQARAVSDPVRHPLVGWWLEYYIFYVKHRDLAEREEFTEMMLNPSWSDDNVDETSAEPLHYFAGNGINWVRKCLNEVVHWYFRDEAETGSTIELDGLPIASIGQNSWLDSVALESIVDASEPEITVGVDDKITASEIDQTLRTYEFLRANNLVSMSYEDYLRTYGIRVPDAEDPHRPELLRYVRQWTYPTNTVEPTTGRPTSALSWSVAERADKARFFSEPGFIFGVSVARPKVYLNNQVGNGTWFLDNAFSWLPAVLRGDPAASLKVVDGSVVSPLTIANANYVVDVRDLFLHGDQFCNFTPDIPTPAESAGTYVNGAETVAPQAPMAMTDLPTATLAKRYVQSLDTIKSLFQPTLTDDDPVTYAVNYYKVRQDGIVSLDVATAEHRDHTPTIVQGRTF